MTPPDDSKTYMITLYNDRDDTRPLGQFALPLVHVETARKLTFDWARDRVGSFLRMEAKFGHLEEWAREDGLWHPVLLPPLEVGRAKASR